VRHGTVVGYDLFPSHIAWRPQTVMPPSLRHHHHSCISLTTWLVCSYPVASNQFRGGWYLFLWAVCLLSVRAPFSGSGSGSGFSIIFAFFLSFSLFFFYVKFLLLGIPFSFPNRVSIFPLRTTSLEVSLPSLRGTVTFWVPYMAAGPWCGPARPE